MQYLSILTLQAVKKKKKKKQAAAPILSMGRSLLAFNLDN